MSAAEVRLATMAINKTNNTEVQAFADTLIADYNEALHKLIKMRAARTTVRATPETTTVSAQSALGGERMHRTANDIPITPDHQRIAYQLSSLSGDEFDRRFISVMIQEHRKVINLFEAETRGSGNAPLKTHDDTQTYSLEQLVKDLDTADFARATLPTLCLHLERAQALQRQLQKR